MEIQFSSTELQRLYTDNVGAEEYSAETVMLFRRRVRHIEASRDLDDLRSAGGVRYLPAKQDSEGTGSLALDGSFCLVISEQDKTGTKPILIHKIALTEATDS